MPGITPAETLRSAAKLMRERAEKATPGPWRPVAGIWGSETFAAIIGRDGIAEDAETWLMATGRGARSQEADADHAASWHPLVALAVADWLSERGLDATGAFPKTGGGWSFSGCDDPPGIEAALKIARLYLGEVTFGIGGNSETLSAPQTRHMAAIAVALADDPDPHMADVESLAGYLAEAGFGPDATPETAAAVALRWMRNREARDA